MAVILLLLLAAAGLYLFTAMAAKKVEAALPPQGRIVEAAGVRFHVHEQGQGPALLLIHGLGGEMRNFTYGVAGRLAQEFRVVVIDRPGSGYSVRPPSAPADLSTQAAAIAALIETLQIGPALVVGHSLGGAVALTLAVEQTRHVAGLALLAPLTHLPEKAEAPAAFRSLTIERPWLRAVYAWTLNLPFSIARRDEVLDQVFGPEKVPDDFAIRGGGLMGVRPSQFIAASRDLQAIPERLPAVASRYEELRMPIRLLFGRGDRIVDPSANGLAFAERLPHAQLQMVDGGHMLPVTQPALAAEFIRETALHIWRSDGRQA
jgi:pimeloyl-ACP methyl ester carboxylesterase